MNGKEQPCLIAYFSRRGQNHVNGKIEELAVGNTERVAGMLQEMTGGRLFQIQRTVPYPVDYRETVTEAVRELKENARPPIVGRAEGLEACRVLLLGYPNWCGTMPMPVWTFLESYDLRDKVILPFCTNEGSGMGRSEADIRRLCPGAEVRAGLPIRGSQADQSAPALQEWLKRMFY